MGKDKLNDENYGTRDKRGHWKPFGTIGINPPRDMPTTLSICSCSNSLYNLKTSSLTSSQVTYNLSTSIIVLPPIKIVLTVE